MSATKTSQEEDFISYSRKWGGWKKLAQILYLVHGPIPPELERSIMPFIKNKRGAPTRYDLHWYFLMREKVTKLQEAKPSPSTKKAIEMVLQKEIPSGNRSYVINQANKHYSAINSALIRLRKYRSKKPGKLNIAFVSEI